MSSLLTMRRAGQAHPAYKTKPFQLSDFTENGLNHMSATPRQACLMIERRQENVGVGDVRCKYRTSRVSMARCVAESWEPRSTSSKLYHRPTSPPRLKGLHDVVCQSRGSPLRGAKFSKWQPEGRILRFSPASAQTHLDATTRCISSDAQRGITDFGVLILL